MRTYRFTAGAQALDAVEDQAVLVQERKPVTVVDVPEGGDHERGCLRAAAA